MARAGVSLKSSIMVEIDVEAVGDFESLGAGAGPEFHVEAVGFGITVQFVFACMDASRDARADFGVMGGQTAVLYPAY